ncbi:MAG: hypothetical protein IT363_06830 [Methanoregulaceae archaeon]|nr:hypothetical protein [Methanoregulaceae archaeon]
MRRCALIVVLGSLVISACDKPRRVGDSGPEGIRVATGQDLRPAGKSITFPGRPVDIALSKDGRYLFAKDDDGLVVIHARTHEVLQELVLPGGTSGAGIVVDADGGVWLSSAQSEIQRAVAKDGKYDWDRKITLPKPKVGGHAYPCGMQIVGDRLIVALSRSNSVGVANWKTGTFEKELPVHIAPFSVAVEADGKTAWASCWGGPQPKEGLMQASSGSMVSVDARGVVKAASVVRLDLATGAIQPVEVALQPMQMVFHPDGKRMFVAHGNADEVSVIDRKANKRIGRITVKPDAKLPWGSMPNAVALSEDGETLFTANGGDNAVGVVDVESGKVKGFIPAGWYPGALLVRGDSLWIANIKGLGTREQRKDGNYSVYDTTGLISLVTIPGEDELAKMTVIAKEASGVHDSLVAMARGTSVSKHPIPEKLGERSPIEHVVYILKENRTYDQIFGDVKEADGDPKLCIFGEDVTPNHHALAREFGLLDNFYCNGVLSADGHSWAMEGAVTGYLEKSFGGFTRSYPYGGDDSINAATTGYLWDHVLGAGLTFQNFGEFDDAKPNPKRTWLELYREHQSGKLTTKYPKRMFVDRLITYTDPDFPGWNMEIPEQIRADIFLEKFAKQDRMANMTIIYLPQDHTSGTSENQPTPRACVADNDLALGRIVEALSKSKYWPTMAIFVIEDDPQNGFDHIDGHRSICLVVSPYSKRGSVNSDFFNQTSALHTMLRILGIKPMTSFTSASPVMTSCFTETPDFTPYTLRPAKIALDELNKPKSAMNAFERKWADLSEAQDLSKMDAIEDDTMNRILWHSVRGTEPYPAAWAGAHGRGLDKKGLKRDPRKSDEEEEDEEE